MPNCDECANFKEWRGDMTGKGTCHEIDDAVFAQSNACAMFKKKVHK
jgi:hypothetical protein